MWQLRLHEQLGIIDQAGSCVALLFSECIIAVLDQLILANDAVGWPDNFDRTLTGMYLALIVGLPLAGYFVMVCDFRRYLRSLRRALIVVAHVVPKTPYWALRSRPDCLKVLGLTLPCTESDVMTAYRKKAKEMHPDRGGELDDFLRLQRYFEQALQLVRKEAELAERTGTVRAS